MSVYKAINKVQAALSRQGISKTNTNSQQGYKFRGIDDVFNALSPLLAEHGLCILPRCTERICTERINAKGTALFYVTVKCEFDFVSADDGSKHTVTTFGEAMDSGDKATNKAMSAAYKYAAFQAFSIPTEGDNDADAQTHDVRPLSDDGNAASKPKTLTAKQVDEVNELLKDRDTTAFLSWASKATGMKITKVSEIPESAFYKIIHALKVSKKENT